MGKDSGGKRLRKGGEKEGLKGRRGRGGSEGKVQEEWEGGKNGTEGKGGGRKEWESTTPPDLWAVAIHSVQKIMRVPLFTVEIHVARLVSASSFLYFLFIFQPERRKEVGRR
jgi:hypothetical protein